MSCFRFFRTLIYFFIADFFLLNDVSLRFLSTHGDTLRNVFGAVSCEHRDPMRTYVTRLSRLYEPDDLHADTEWKPGFIDLLLRYVLMDNRVPITVLGYPHENWSPTWGGHTEFAALDWTSPARANPHLRNSTPIALNVEPRPERSVIFEGPCLSISVC